MKRHLYTETRDARMRRVKKQRIERKEEYYRLMLDAASAGVRVAIQHYMQYFLHVLKVRKNYIVGFLAERGERLCIEPPVVVKMMYRGSWRYAYSVPPRFADGYLDDERAPQLMGRDQTGFYISHDAMSVLREELARRMRDRVLALGYNWLVPDLWRIAAAYLVRG